MDAVALGAGVPTRAVIGVDAQCGIYAKRFWDAVALEHEGEWHCLGALLDEEAPSLHGVMSLKGAQ